MLLRLKPKCDEIDVKAKVEKYAVLKALPKVTCSGIA